MMEFEKLPSGVYDQIALGAGTILTEFSMSTRAIDRSKVLFPTTGGVTFTDKPRFEDFGADIDNCPRNTKELKRVVDREVRLSGTAIGNTPAAAKLLAVAADIDNSTGKITPRDLLGVADFTDIWFVVDYSSINRTANGNTAGVCAVKLMNVLSTGGLSIVTTDAEKSKFAFELTAHYSAQNPDVVPYELYMIAGTAAQAGN